MQKDIPLFHDSKHFGRVRIVTNKNSFLVEWYFSEENLKQTNKRMKQSRTVFSHVLRRVDGTGKEQNTYLV